MAYPLGGQALINAILFYVEGQCMKLLQPQGGTHDQSIPNSIVSGAIAGGVQSIVCSPMELIKLRMQVQGMGEARSARNHTYRGPWQTTKLIWQKDGFRKGIMKGFNMTIARECTSFGLYFSSYRFFCKAFASTEGSVDDLGLFWRSLSGGMTGCVVWIASYPFDVVKTKIQTDGISGKHVYHGSWDCFKKLYAKNGSKVFFKGLNPCLVRGFLNNFSLLPAADYVKKYWPW